MTMRRVITARRCDKVLTPDFMSLIVFVELYRNGAKVAAATKACPGKYSCWAGGGIRRQHIRQPEMAGQGHLQRCLE
ncbi:MAG: hypothetical protein HOZ81_12975 [Streptomyces sp.]|nr:hypothetical protein [Streptomyces sp.]